MNVTHYSCRLPARAMPSVTMLLALIFADVCRDLKAMERFAAILMNANEIPATTFATSKCRFP